MQKDNIKDIIEYWELIEFLGQADYPKVSSSDWYQGILLPHTISSDSQFKDILEKDKKTYPKFPVVSNNIDLCLGKIDREDCMKLIYDLCGQTDDRVEKTKGHIALCGLQISTLSRYVWNSFNLSPVVWCMYKLTKYKIEELPVVINKKNYEKDLKLFEDMLREKDELSMNDIMSCYQKIKDTFMLRLTDINNANFTGAFIYQRFMDDGIKEKKDETLGYSNLNMDFYGKDLNFVKDVYLKGEMSKAVFGRKFLMPFITCKIKANQENTDKRIDILKSSKETTSVYKKVMHVKNSPLGKWPSKFYPSFMQQFAINNAIATDDNEKDFISVNGPPGTGKTTLLKEIIADTIVKKAMWMASFEDSDDAFTKKKFVHGDKLNNGYHEGLVFNNYYAVDDSINCYAILVASCNNAAVENITKELPDGKSLISGLKVEGCMNDQESGLKQVYELFEQNEDKDIYFTNYANEFFNNEKENSYYWGLISVPLGNKMNQNAFIKVLKQLFFQSMNDKETINAHKELYKATILKMKRQAKIVKKMRDDLSIACEREADYERRIASKKDTIAQLYNKIAITNKSVQKESENINTIKGTIKETKLEYEKGKKIQQILNNEYKKQEDILNKLSLEYETIKKDIYLLEDGRGFKEIICKIFKISTLREANIKSKYLQMQEMDEKIKLQKKNYDEARESYSAIAQQNITYEMNTSKYYENISQSEKNINEYKIKSENALSEIEVIEKSMVQEKINYTKWLKESHKCNTDLNSFDCLDDETIENLFSNDEKGIEAHLKNPWMSEKYNREREKLFYYSLQVNKEFILSSHAMRCNIKNLLTMWTHGDGKHIITYHDQDRFNAFPHLMQSLSVLIPVISTTFASIGRFLDDVRKPFDMGYLIIDEAGQAQPHMALGAMVRSRKTVIVGDPNQVEPVVTDDLTALKRLLKSDIRTPYMDKCISVQDFADCLNPYGTYYKDTKGIDKWVGSPLVVHRRCISPMFEISNMLSYNQVMKQQTELPSLEKEKSFVLSCSQWINIEGKENDRKKKDHYVKEQGLCAVGIVEQAFNKSMGNIPSIFLISPFASVINGFRKEIKSSEFYRLNKSEKLDKWIKDFCGTVHTFQGKEANEVIFMLGCDQDAKSAVSWVNTNIFNVAVTRAKYRLCVVGDYLVWKYNRHARLMKGIIDAYTLKLLKSLESESETSENKQFAELLLRRLPNTNEFVDAESEESDIHVYDLMKGCKQAGFSFNQLTDEELKQYDLQNLDLKALDYMSRNYLIAGIKINAIFKTIVNKYQFTIADYSFANILFCKSFESRLRVCFSDGLKKHFGEIKLQNKKIKDCEPKDFMSGVTAGFLKRHIVQCANICDDNVHNQIWWEEFVELLQKTARKRNDCCHCSNFTKEDEEELINLLFYQHVYSNIAIGKNLEARPAKIEQTI